MAAPPPLLTATRVSKRYRLPGGRELLAVDDVSLSIDRGGCAVLAGASGSGKSTLLSLLGGLARPSSGEICFDGEKLGGCSDARLAVLRRRIGFVFQNYLLLPRLPIWEGATYGLIPLGCSREARRKTAGEWLARLGLGDRLDQKPEELSGGEQQRVALARALVGDPELIVADEPTSNLDPAAADVVLALFQELLSAGKTLLLATHDPRLIALATWRGAMEQGQLRP